ncbi:MAG: bifunctional (p)ppGpp synthetase/guanosine-3',5'-bis(diphosphate) 3'-pyrophosphohydrolase [Clostridiales bacterium]|nr:bifunctional (p)ppGpp synthetase/guanosine-3',5'-bis(diphosphate) 3'-pyrophosphohydrolase [Clostridiales bacterium]MBR6484644.1 bifunctional (p)ppGpp synthetase/guanosine-3',5'-bis(diphosphate) 3'-pyrophosphohydrolase [Clostridiales bacterium]
MNRANVTKEELDRGVDLIERAYYFAYKAHRNQKRKNGEMYIVHPIATAEILAELEVDAESLAAALLHDTVEDTEADTEMITELFGKTMTVLVEGVTKLNKLSSISKEEGQRDNVNKMLIAMTKDIRVILIKLADRLHNMRTMQYQTPEKQLEKARETLDIYVPFAERFGVFKIKGELEDLCLRYIDHDGYYELVGLISAKRSEREAFIAQVVGEIREKIDAFGIKDFDIEGRPKRFYSIWKKMRNKDRDISQIYDMYACRIIVNSVAECYMVLGIVHEMYIPLPGRFKDYIGNPKENGYQSLHTTVKRPGGKTFGETTFEVQIRTYSMHREAEFGIASHWHYKESGGSTAFDADVYDKRVDWVRQFLEAQKDAEDPKDFLELFKTNVAPGEVFVFTPKGKILRLPEGSCPIDFAYSIHSGIGNHMHGAKVNNRIVPLSYELKNGDVVEILSSEKIKGPSKDWIKMVKTASARSKINSWFKKEARAENIVEGKEKLEREIERNGFTLAQLTSPEILKVVLPKYSYNTMDDMYAAVGYGSVAVVKLFGRLRDEYIKTLSEEERLELGYRTTSDGQVVYYSPADLPEELGKGDQIRTPKKTAPKKPEKTPEKNRLENDVIIEGMDNFAVHLAKCCHPAPGDRIIGYITQNGGVGIHREGCTNIVNVLKYKDRSIKDRQRAERIVQAQWGSGKTSGVYDVKIGITATDRNYLLIDILSMLKEENINVEKIDTHISADFIAEINMTITVKSLEQYDRVIGRIKSVKDIIDVVRL